MQNKAPPPSMPDGWGNSHRSEFLKRMATVKVYTVYTPHARARKPPQRQTHKTEHNYQMQHSNKPKYTALYKKYDYTKPLNAGEIESIAGNNKQKLHQALNAITRRGEPYVWAIRDDGTGIYIEGGTTSHTIGKCFLWNSERINEIAKRFFDTKQKAHKRQKKAQKVQNIAF